MAIRTNKEKLKDISIRITETEDLSSFLDIAQAQRNFIETRAIKIIDKQQIDGTSE